MTARQPGLAVKVRRSARKRDDAANDSAPLEDRILDTFPSGHYGLLALLRSLMDLSLGPAGERYALTPDLPGIACYGHFTSSERAWEEIRF